MLKMGNNFLISQSFLKDVNKALCPKYLYFKHVKGMETPASEQMNKGKYFEHHLLGACRGEVPTFETLKNGNLSQTQKDLDGMVEYAKKVMQDLGVDIANGQTQLRIETDLFVGHLDLVTTDFQNKERKCIIDVKFTNTGVDDRWNGWGGVETGGDNGTPQYNDAKIQALQYVKLYKDKFGEILPFYFFIFGESGKDNLTGEKKKWCRVLKFVLHTGVMFDYEEKQLVQLQRTLEFFNSTNWAAKPEYNKCLHCAFRSICTDKAKTPEIERIDVTI